jgi:pimeloyl-ACP methyl ester carboxylesterase
MNLLFRLLGVTAGLLISLWSSQAHADYERHFDVELRPGVTSTLRVVVRENARHRGRCSGPTLAFVHGLSHSAATWNPLVDELFGNGRRGAACKALLIDLPGHGASSLPTGMAYGELLVDDYVTATGAALDELRALGLRPAALVGHSMGGLIVEGLQARLLANGSSLARRYGIRSVALLSPSAAAEQPWQLAESGVAATLVGTFLAVDPLKGLVVHLDAPTWGFLFFTTLADVPSPGTPSPAEIEALGYDVDEAGYAGAEVVGAPPFARLSVGARPFDPRYGTRLTLVSPSQDKFSQRDEARAAYVQLTGDTRLSGFTPVDDDYAVHDMHVADPHRYFSLALQGFLGTCGP